MWSSEASVATDDEEDDLRVCHMTSCPAVTMVTTATNDVTTCTWSSSDTQPSVFPLPWPIASLATSHSDTTSWSSSADSRRDDIVSPRRDDILSPRRDDILSPRLRHSPGDKRDRARILSPCRRSLIITNSDMFGRDIKRNSLALDTSSVQLTRLSLNDLNGNDYELATEIMDDPAGNHRIQDQFGNDRIKDHNGIKDHDRIKDTSWTPPQGRPTDLKISHSRHVMPDLISTDEDWPGTMWMDVKGSGNHNDNKVTRENSHGGSVTMETNISDSVTPATNIPDDVHEAVNPNDSVSMATSPSDGCVSMAASSYGSCVDGVSMVSTPSSSFSGGIYVDSVLGPATMVTSVVTSPTCSVSSSVTPLGASPSGHNTFQRNYSVATHVTVSQGTSSVQAQVAYAPTTCGCFYNKHSLTHMLGLCKLPLFRKKCKNRGVTKRKDCVYALYTPKLQVRGQHGNARGMPSCRDNMPAVVDVPRRQGANKNTQSSDAAEKRHSRNLSVSSKSTSGKKASTSAKSNLEAVTRQLSEIDYGFNPTFASSSVPKDAFLSLRKERQCKHGRVEGVVGLEPGAKSSGKKPGFWTLKFKSMSQGNKKAPSGARQRAGASNRPGMV